MGVGGYDGFIALAKEVRRARRDQAERLERRRQQVDERRERLLARGEDLSGPVEGMTCPGCLRHYPFGDNCTHCGTELVCASLVGAMREPTPPRLSLSAFPALALLVAILIVGGSVGVVLLLGSIH